MFWAHDDEEDDEDAKDDDDEDGLDSKLQNVQVEQDD
jgi:Ran GTPase-activating protein 1